MKNHLINVATVGFVALTTAVSETNVDAWFKTLSIVAGSLVATGAAIRMLWQFGQWAGKTRLFRWCLSKSPSWVRIRISQ